MSKKVIDAIRKREDARKPKRKSAPKKDAEAK